MVQTTAGKIRDEIQRRLHERAPDGECSNCKAPLPVRSEINAYGSHWSLGTLEGTPVGCISLLLEVVGEVMADYDLIE